EAPIWKTSYRLVLDADKKARPYLQGWALVENPTDEDWGNVRMALVSGRPISFRMNLYDPLYVPRPTVEPELFASLRPPTYSGGFNKQRPDDKEQTVYRGLNGADQPAVAGRPAVLAATPAVPEAKAREESLKLARDPQGEERKLYAGAVGRELAGPLNTGAVGNAATAGRLGD